ncbi:folate-binding protein [Pseudovibrio exalbescens]|uniref:CAF17-like 4Fe-4S cluster assembly/insertion protein YgfZ n=1 Tax=Pseudovibrio exalbescens TaxID=197461 RepID=UPI002366C717|nr:folate-binding protein [Pseudovibrio exalbescens]MDD7911217.1 folate-binding protein [Pseudovibrio exalbescens]
MQTKVTSLNTRGVLRIGGEDALHFLNNLVTCDIEKVSAERATFGALLTPQGKILWDFFIHAAPEHSFYLEAPKDELSALQKRLTFYKLRAKVTIDDVSDTVLVAVSWDGPLPEGFVPDPRLNSLGGRAVLPVATTLPLEKTELSTPQAWHQHRLSLGVPESMADFALGDTFPHDADMDSLNGVAFEKGCYVGQEVVSRMKHRGTARKRIVVVQGTSGLPESGTEVTASGKVLGVMGSSEGDHGLALLRLDRVKQAIDAGEPILAGDVALEVTIPDWAGFDWPS